MAVRRKRLVMTLIAVVGLAGCATTSPPNEPPAAVTATTAAATAVVTASTPSTGPALATPAVPTVDPLAFFRAQEAVCARHAASTANPGVDPERFADVTQVRDLGDGAYLVRDGQGTQLVVEPAKGIVLPESGRAGDLMPQPYGFGCPETVFVGGADG